MDSYTPMHCLSSELVGSWKFPRRDNVGCWDLRWDSADQSILELFSDDMMPGSDQTQHGAGSAALFSPVGGVAVLELNPPPTLADMEGARHLRSGAFTPPHHHRRQLLLLRVVSLVVLAGCGNGSSAQDTTNTRTRIDRSPRLASPQAKRMILIFDRHETGEGRLESLRGVRDDGYTCWFFPWTFSAAVCLQNNDTTAAIIPDSATDLRSILWRVNLKKWLPSVLCPARHALTPSPASGTRSSQDDHDCIEVVEDAFRGSEPDAKAFTTVPRGVSLITSATIEETPWVQAMARCMEPDFAPRMQPFECRNIYALLASVRERDQLLPALETLSRNAAATIAASTAASSTLAPEKHLLPSSENIQRLLQIVRPYSQAPSLRMIAPSVGGRTSGSVFAFVAHCTLGTALEARLAEALGPSADQQGETEQALAGSSGKGPTTTQSDENEAGKGTTGIWWGGSAARSGDKLSADAGGKDGNWHHGQDEEAPRLPPLEHCEVRGVLDGVEAVRIPLSAAKTHANLAAKAVFPVYPPRCSEHPLQEAMKDRVGDRDGGAWDASEDVFYLEARDIERICTADSFGIHRVHAELSCCTAGATDESASHEASTEAGDSTRPGSRCEVFAKTAPVEYFHTGNGADVYSSWEHEDGESGGGGRSGLLDAPPEDISVSLYLESAPETIRTTVAVPRWSSDGDVWEAAFRACSETFGPHQAVMTDKNDCVHLATSAIRAKRVDLFNRMSLRLDAFLRSKDPTFVFEGHTGHNPEKVEALGAMSRGGGERVSMVCEVGFNAGHSSLNWLLSSPPTTRVLAFDLGEHGYVEHALAFLQEVFPGRIYLVVGDSAVTVPAYAAEARREGSDPRACDVVFVDGNHSEDGAYTDLVNFQALASRGRNAFAVDDMDMDSVSAAWRRFREEGRGRLERVVESTAESYTRMEKNEAATEGNSWDAHFEKQSFRYFTQRGFFSLGIGYLRPPPEEDTEDA